MKVSVIVCTFNRSQVIVKCLDSIVASLEAAAPVEGEIIVVDNASTDDTSAVINKWKETCVFPVQALYEPKKGVSAARNCALRAAKGEFLVFTDDDCQLDKEYIRDALRHNANDTHPVLRGGYVAQGDPTDLPLTIKTSAIVERYSREMNSAKLQNLGGVILGCNMAMSRTVADMIGRFDERLGAGISIPAGEDTDYMFRAYMAGILIEYVPDMKVFHFHGRKTANVGYKLIENYCVGDGALYAKYIFTYPDFCRQLYWDMKGAVKSASYRKESFMTQINFPRADKLRCIAKGMLLFVWAKLKDFVSVP